MDLLRLIFIDEVYGNLKVVTDCGVLTKNIKRKKNLTIYKPIDVHFVANGIDEIEVRMVFLVIRFFVGR